MASAKKKKVSLKEAIKRINPPKEFAGSDNKVRKMPVVPTPGGIKSRMPAPYLGEGGKYPITKTSSTTKKKKKKPGYGTNVFS